MNQNHLTDDNGDLQTNIYYDFPCNFSSNNCNNHTERPIFDNSPTINSQCFPSAYTTQYLNTNDIPTQYTEQKPLPFFVDKKSPLVNNCNNNISTVISCFPPCTQYTNDTPTQFVDQTSSTSANTQQVNFIQPSNNQITQTGYIEFMKLEMSSEIEIIFRKKHFSNSNNCCLEMRNKRCYHSQCIAPCTTQYFNHNNTNNISTQCIDQTSSTSANTQQVNFIQPSNNPITQTGHIEFMKLEMSSEIEIIFRKKHLPNSNNCLETRNKRRRTGKCPVEQNFNRDPNVATVNRFCSDGKSSGGSSTNHAYSS